MNRISTFTLAGLGAFASMLFGPGSARADYIEGFKRFWGAYLTDSSGVVSTALVVGAICLYIISRGKWAK